MPSSHSVTDERQNAEKYAQAHLFAFWDELNAREQQTLLDEIKLANCENIRSLLDQSKSQKDDWSALAQRAELPEAIRLNQSGGRFSAAEAQTAGEAALRASHVGAILVAGGQGTRLGFDHPKGMYSIGPVSGVSLFQILLEKILAIGHRYCVKIPLYVMTSDATHEETETYFKANNYFGLAAENVRLFCQGVMPAIDATSGRILLADKGHVALNPDGHGGMLAALERTGALVDMQRRGLEQLFYFQVDNPLVQICDPLFLGYHILYQSEMSTLAVAKREPLERVGNLVRIDGRTQVIEYSDFPDAVAHQTNADGTLRFWAGSVAIHVFETSFLARANADKNALPFHVARKKVSYINEQGDRVDPAEPNAVKFERFIFDLIPLAKNAVVVEGAGNQWFSPVKNPPGDKRDSPDTCRAAMIALHRQWLAAAGANVADNMAVEISPLFAFDAAELRSKIKPGTVINKPTYLR